MKRSHTPTKLAAVDDVCAFEQQLPEMVRKLIARVERLDRNVEALDTLVRHDVGLLIDEQREQRRTLETIKDLLTEALAK